MGLVHTVATSLHRCHADHTAVPSFMPEAIHCLLVSLKHPVGLERPAPASPLTSTVAVMRRKLLLKW